MHDIAPVAIETGAANPPKRTALLMSFALLLLNMAGAVLYLVLTSRSWKIPAEQAQGIYVTTGEPIVWALAAFPILGAFTLLNLTWGTFIFVRRDWHAAAVWLLTSVIWLAAMCVDFAHH